MYTVHTSYIETSAPETRLSALSKREAKMIYMYIECMVCIQMSLDITLDTIAYTWHIHQIFERKFNPEFTHAVFSN